MSRKSISIKTTKKLFAESLHCCFPECSAKLFDRENNVLIAEICHIVAVNSGGARYETNFTSDKNTYDNLLLMCPTHHKIIDENPTKYSKEILNKFKNDHIEKCSKSNLINETEGETSEHREGSLSDIEINKIIDTLKNQESITLPPKKKYPPIPNYIKRKLSPVLNENEAFGSNPTINDVLLKNKKITILGVAGAGKSIELNNLANFHSESENGLHPVKIRLNYITNESIEEILSIECSEFKKIPQNRLLIILDALDEVHSDHIDAVSNKIILFSKNYPNSTIVVSCRNNFYTTENVQRNAKLEGFATFLLKPLNHSDIIEYLEQNNVPKIESFIKKLESEKLYNLLFSPFYLINLVNFHLTKNALPNNKREIFEYLINQRILEDLEKYKNTGIRIRDFQAKVEDAIEMLAVSAECLGRNYLLEKEEFQRLITDSTLLQVLRHTFLFNKTHTDKWEFEHNNFQEFLASKYLSKLGFQSIQKFVSFEKEFKKIKPSWLNTLSFLFSNLDIESEVSKQLITWIIEIEPDVLVRFERDRISLTTRENIFEQIFENYQSKAIVIRNEKFESEDLARFISDSTKVLNYLIEKSKNEPEGVKFTESIRLFKYFDQRNEYKKQIQDILFSRINDPLVSKETKFYCLKELSNLEISSKVLSKNIVKLVESNPNQYFRAGVYKYLSSSNYYEDYCDLYLKGLKLIDRNLISGSSSQRDEVHLGDEKYNLETILKKINTTDNVKKVIEWLSNLDYLHKPIYIEIARLYILKAESIYNSRDKSIFNPVFSFLISIGRKYQKELKVELRDFFSNTKTSTKVFKKLYSLVIQNKDGDKLNNGFALGMIMNSENVDYLISEIRQKKIKDDQIYVLRNSLNLYGEKEVHDKFYNYIIKLKKRKFEYIPQFNYELSRKLKKKKDIDLLFSQAKFKKEVENIFKQEKKISLKEDELWDYKKAHFTDEIINNDIILDTLKNHAKRNGSVTANDIFKMMNNKENWKWFTLHKLVSYDSHDSSHKFGIKETAYIKKWVLESLPKANFETAIQKNTSGGYHYRYTEVYIPYFTERLNIKLSEQNYLSFLNVDCYLIPSKNKDSKDNVTQVDTSDEFEKHNTISEFVFSKVNAEKVKKRIVKNIKNKKLPPLIEFNHFILCKKHVITDCLTEIFDNIFSDKYSIEQKKSLVEFFIYLKGDIKKIESSLPKFEQELKIYALNILAKGEKSNIAEYCINEINAISDENTQLTYINILLKINTSTYFSYLKNWILEYKKLPERIIAIQNLKSDNLNDLIEIYDSSLKYNFGNEYWYDRSEYLGGILEFGSISELSYKLTKEKIEFWLITYPDTKYLYYQLQKLDQLYYSKKQQSMTIKEVMSLIG